MILDMRKNKGEQISTNIFFRGGNAENEVSLYSFGENAVNPPPKKKIFRK